jgi:hypothetical protein
MNQETYSYPVQRIMKNDLSQRYLLVRRYVNEEAEAKEIGGKCIRWLAVSALRIDCFLSSIDLNIKCPETLEVMSND